MEMTDQDNEGMELYLGVCGIVRATRDELWVIALTLEREGDCYRSISTRPSVVRLDDQIRRVAALHRCTERCSINVRLSTISHDRSVLNGGHYWLLGKRDGYPPHMG